MLSAECTNKVCEELETKVRGLSSNVEHAMLCIGPDQFIDLSNVNGDRLCQLEAVHRIIEFGIELGLPRNLDQPL